MPHAALESLRNALVAAQLHADAALQDLALRRYEAVCEAIAAQPLDEQPELHERVFRMLPCDWPLWIESLRPRVQTETQLSQAA